MLTLSAFRENVWALTRKWDWLPADPSSAVDKWYWAQVLQYLRSFWNHPHLQTSATSFSGLGVERGSSRHSHLLLLWSLGGCHGHLHCHKLRNNYMLHQLMKTLHHGLYWMSGGFGFPSIYLGQQPRNWGIITAQGIQKTEGSCKYMVCFAFFTLDCFKLQ